MDMKFTKMHGIGNDYVYVNCFEEKVEDTAAEYMKRLYADKAFYDIIKNNALSHINEVLSEERITVMMRERVEAIRKEAKEALKKNEEK